MTFNTATYNKLANMASEFYGLATPTNTGGFFQYNPEENWRNTNSTSSIDWDKVKPYSTKESKGKEDNNMFINANMTDKTNVCNDYQGELRYGYLNDDSMKKRIEADFAKTGGDKRFTKEMVVTHCNEFLDEKQDSKYYSDNPFGMEERK